MGHAGDGIGAGGGESRFKKMIPHKKMMLKTLARACAGTSDRESQDSHRRICVCCEYERTKPEMTTLPRAKRCNSPF